MSLERRNTTQIVISAIVGTVTVLSALVLSVRYLETRLNRIENKLTAFESASVDRWTATNMKTWAVWLSQMNPTLNVPPTDVMHHADSP